MVQTVDYDLVIVGATQAGLLLARRAIAHRQRVALVMQSATPCRDMQMQALQKIMHHAIDRGMTDIAQVMACIDQAIAPWDFYEPLAKLAEMGVDVVTERGQFAWQPQTVFTTATRQLRGKHYAIATGASWGELQDSTQHLPTDLLHRQTWEALETKVLVIGADPWLLTLAYVLQTLGKQVQLVVPGSFLGAEDVECTHRLQTFLEAAGLEIFKGLTAIDRENLTRQPHLSVIRGDRRHGKTHQLNLPPDCCQGVQMWLTVDGSLQTSHRYIYGCGSVLGGYDLPELAIAETSLLATNLATRQKRPCLYQHITYRLFEPYPFDHVGYQERDLPTGSRSLEKILPMDRVDQLTFPLDVTVKLFLSPKQQILGATVLGDRQGKLIRHCHHLIQQKASFSTWDNLLEASGLSAEICW